MRLKDRQTKYILKLNKTKFLKTIKKDVDSFGFPKGLISRHSGPFLVRQDIFFFGVKNKDWRQRLIFFSIAFHKELVQLCGSLRNLSFPSKFWPMLTQDRLFSC